MRAGYLSRWTKDYLWQRDGFVLAPIPLGVCSTVTVPALCGRTTLYLLCAAALSARTTA